MATFNPQFQQPYEQNYLGWAKETREPMPDKSTGMALETAAQGIEGAATIADRAVKQNIESTIQQKVDNERGQFTQALEAIQGKSTPTTNNPSDAMDLMPEDNKPQAPAAVDNQISRVSSLHNAYSGNKISETSYYQNLNTILKDVRAQYPGYRDYVDEKVSSITGVNPANAYMAGMVRDINEQRTKAAAEQSYYEKQIVNSGFTGSQEMLASYQAGKTSIGRVQQWLASNNERSEGLKRAVAEFTLADKARSDYTSRAANVAQAAADHAATDYFYNSHFIKNDPNSPTGAQIQDAVNNWIAHPEEAAKHQDQVQQYTMMLNQMKARAYTETKALLDGTRTQSASPDTGKPQSVTEALGPVQTKAMLDASIGQVYDKQIEALTNQDLGLVHSIQNTVASRVNNAAYQLTDGSSDLAKIMTTFGALGKISQTMSPELQGRVIGGYTGKTGDIGSDLYDFATHQLRMGVTQTGNTDGTPYTHKQAQTEQDRASSAVNATPTDRSTAAKSLLDLSKALTEKDPRVVDNAISFFYDPSSKGSLNKYMDDYYDPNRGWIVSGRTSAFAKLTDNKVTESIWKRSQSGNPNAFTYYKDWAVNEAGANLTNIAKTWSDNVALNNEKHIGGLEQFSLRSILGGKDWKGDKATNHQFYYDNEAHKLWLLDSRGEIVPENSWRLDPSIFALRNANKYFESLANIAHAEGSDPNAIIFQTLRTAWPLDPESQKVFRAITQSHMKPEPEKKNGP